MTKTSKKTPATTLRTRNAGAGIAEASAGSRSRGTKPAGAPKAPSKQQQLAALVLRDEGATVDQMIAGTGWLPHTTRAALTGLRRKGYAISSDKVDGVRTYRGIAPE
jgi:hypothetical protein